MCQILTLVVTFYVSTTFLGCNSLPLVLVCVPLSLITIRYCTSYVVHMYKTVANISTTAKGFKFINNAGVLPNTSSDSS